MEYGLIGEHLPHSFSKEIHEKCADYQYELLELSPQRVADFMTQAPFKAINVTIPYKQVVIPFLTEIDQQAKAIGAVNTVVNRNGKLYGYNTDFYGMQALLDHIGLSLSGKKVLILGTGGTSRTAQAVAITAGAASVVVAGRSAHPPYVTYEEAYARHSDAEIVINTTPCGMYPYADGTDGRAAVPLDIARFPRLLGVADAVYNPLRTNLILDARSRGLPAEGGLYMLVAQAVKASRIFQNKSTDGMKEQTEEIFRAVRLQKENIVLTGMPACGKSTVGKRLATLLDRPFIDTDDEIVKKVGKEIPQIFAESGEAGFRALEAEVLRQIAGEASGAVIATGGGAILRDDNVRALKRTGRIYFLDRSPSALIPTKNRPLASTVDALKQRYRERYPRYCATCDLRVETDEVIQHTVETIRKDFLYEAFGT
ncbi:MAG: shikimate dehydrogenase [Clostridia bacterium]|nr:shikimate dehydrogenase [Clostridia bacterium]